MLLSNVKEIEIPEGKVKQIAKGPQILWKKQGVNFVNFLVSNGPQYINTGLSGGRYIIEFGAQATGMPLNGCLPIGTTDFYVFFPSRTQTAFNTTGVQQLFGNTPLQYHIYKSNASQLYVDGILKSSRALASQDGNLWLFKASGYTDRASTLKMSFCKIWNYETNELIRDYVPALDSNNRAGFYDRVAGTMVYSEMGDFLYE